MKESRFAGIVSAYEERFRKKGGMNVHDSLAICKLLEDTVNSVVTMNAAQVESTFQTIEMIACHGDGTTSPVRMDVMTLANFINSCRG